MVQQLPRDEISERAVLAGLLRHGGSVYNDVADILNSQCFTDQQHETIYIIFDYILKKSPNAKLDIATTLATAQELGLYASYFDTEYKLKYLRSLENLNIQSGNVRPQAQKLRKLLIARNLRQKLKEADRLLEEIGGTETFTQIVSKAEQPIYDIINEVTKRETSQIVKMSEVVDAYIQNIVDNPDAIIGISTGYPYYDEVIGGGYRKGKVNVVAARLKVGKSQFGANVAINVNKQGIPVLILDLELNPDDQLPRMLANVSGITINHIEKGEFTRNAILKRKLDKGIDEFKEYPMYHVQVGGLSFEEILSTCRRWITRYVGFDKTGQTNPCLIIYDYLDVHDSNELNNLQETQVLGLYMTGLENFASQYDVPIMVLAQTNRDGISQETSNVVAGSDRIARKCANLSIIKYKSEEEMSKDGPELGDRKLVVVATRFGEGHAMGEYVHLGSNLRCGQFIETGCRVSTGPESFVNKTKKAPEIEIDPELIEF